MVGVPRNTGCRACLQRRMKCDQTQPECRRCQSRNLACPGYERRLKFYNTTTPNTTNPPTQNASPSPSSHLSHPKPPTPSMDQALAPNLVAKAIDIQVKEIFDTFGKATFPGTWAAFGPRVSPSWTQFLFSSEAAQTPPMLQSMRAINTLYLGQRFNDPRLLHTSRQIYASALHSLSAYLAAPKNVTSDSALASAIVLGVYEVFNGVGPESWVVHSRGIGTLFRMRGAGMHREGFGRTLYVTWRSFLVAEAFLRGEACFLGEGGWREMGRETVLVEGRRGVGSAFGEVVEGAFGEVVLGPGLYRRTSDFISGEEMDGGKDREERKRELVEDITHSRDVLYSLQRQLTLLVVPVGQAMALKQKNVYGPISADAVPSIAQPFLQGIQSSLALLDQLLVLLEAHTHQTGPADKNPWGTLTPRIEEVDETGTGQGPMKPDDWVDRLTMSMGTLALKI